MSLLKNKETMIRVDGFDSIKIYEQVASKLSEELLKEGLSLDIKLAKNKWNAFKEKIRQYNNFTIYDAT